MIHVRLCRREARAGRLQLVLFGLCVSLAVIALGVVSGWRATVERALASENRKSLGGDVSIYSGEPFSSPLREALKGYAGLETTELFTLARGRGEAAALLCKLKTVGPGYPFYGELPLRSGRPLEQVLRDGFVVEPAVLERLGVQVGAPLSIGELTLPIADVALAEPDRPLGYFGFAPRVFVSREQLAQTSLLRAGSRVEHRYYLKLPNPEQATRVAEELRKVALPDQERVDSWKEPSRALKRFVDNFFTFMDLLAVLALALGGLGMQSTLETWLVGRKHTIAVLKATGANRGFLLTQYACIVGATVAVAAAAGLVAAEGILRASGGTLSQMLPLQVYPGLTGPAVLQSLALCLFTAAVFSWRPLRQAAGLKPAILLHQLPEPPPPRIWPLLLAALFALLWALVGQPERAAAMTGIVTVVLAFTHALSALAVNRLRRWRPRNLALRTALGSWRAPTDRTTLVVFVLSTCLTILFTAGLVERALVAAWVDAMPEDAPNLIFLDIPEDRREEFLTFVERPLEVDVVLRLRARSVDGRPLDRSQAMTDKDRAGRRELDGTPSEQLPEGDRLVAGAHLFDPQGGVNQVSLLDEVAESLPARVGQKVTFTLQGVPIEARVASLRSSPTKGFRPRYEAVFPPALVEGAPRRLVGRMRLPADQVATMQTRVATRFPTVTSWDLSHTIGILATRLQQMVDVARTFLYAGLLAGALILVSAASAARSTRVREMAFYKLVGARRAFLVRVLLYENLALGALCSTLSCTLALLLAWGLCSWQLDVPFPAVDWTLALGWLLPTAAITALGWGLTRGVLASRPARVLADSPGTP